MLFLHAKVLELVSAMSEGEAAIEKVSEAERRCGFVAVIGPTNAGKSTLVNALVGAKVAIVSHKVQTTRAPIRGIAMQGNSQIVFIDTAGIFNPKRRLDRAMIDAAWGGLEDADAVLLVLDAAAGFKPMPARNPSLPTLVGLLILILCFFVVLTSISLRNTEREKSVMAGLSQAFSSTGLAPSSPVGEEAETRKLLGDLRAALNAEVPLISGVAPETGDDYVLNLPRGLVFAQDGTSLASGFPGILAQAMHALKTGPADFAYEVEVVLSAPQMDDKAIAGASAIAAALREAGFAKPRIEGLPHCDWVLVDGGDVIVHIFRPEVREFYNIEKMWQAEFAD